MNPDHEQTTYAIAAEVRSRLPALQEMVDTWGAGDMGPDITIPAVWMSLLLSQIELLQARVRIHESEATIRERQSAGSLPLWSRPPDDNWGEYAGALGGHAIRTCEGDRTEAASIMIQGALAVMMSFLPPKEVLATVAAIPELFDLRATLGMGEVRQ